MTFVFLGVVGGTLGQIFGHQFHAFASLLVWAGCLLIVRHAWVTKATWRVLVKSLPFGDGLILAAVGNLMTFRFEP